MVSAKVIVKNPTGLHLRPAGMLWQTASKFDSEIEIVSGNRRIDAKSVLNVMAAGIGCGTEIELICTGSDEEQALKELCTLIENDLGAIDVK